jgi:hypothetical protein
MNKIVGILLMVSVAVSMVWGGPYLPPVDVVVGEPVGRTQPVDSARETREADSPAPRLTADRRRLVREYERNTVGYSQDEGDRGFFDFTASLMVPLLHSFYPDQLSSEESFNHWRPYPYAAATVRGGQYIGGRKSSPVVGKRFNPLLSARWWLPNATAGDGRRADRFVEIVVAHESNGQWVEDETTFDETVALHLANMRRGTFGEGKSEEALRQLAREEARDEISRGWDYVGVNFQWAASLMESEKWHDQLTFSAKFQQYVVLLQDELEEYESWENDPQGKARDRVDGVYLRVNYEFDRVFGLTRYLQLDSQFGVAWRTGIGSPFKYNTWEFEVGGTLVNLPVVFWYRAGYNSDFTDYFRSDESFGIRVIVEGF